MAEITHRYNPDTGCMIQIVSSEKLREILDADGDNYEKPNEFKANDEWDVE